MKHLFPLLLSALFVFNVTAQKNKTYQKELKLELNDFTFIRSFFRYPPSFKLDAEYYFKRSFGVGASVGNFVFQNYYASAGLHWKILPSKSIYINPYLHVEYMHQPVGKGWFDFKGVGLIGGLDVGYRFDNNLSIGGNIHFGGLYGLYDYQYISQWHEPKEFSYFIKGLPMISIGYTFQNSRQEIKKRPSPKE